MGARPWLTPDELRACLDELGHTVVANDDGSDLFPTPPALRTGLGRLTLDWMAWRRNARKRLAAAKVERIVVWDPLVTVLCRLARPRGVEIVWVPHEGDGTVRQRMLLSAARRSADRTAVTTPVLPRNAMNLLDGWVVFGSDRDVSEATLRDLRARATDAPALAVIFDCREPSAIAPAHVAHLREAAQAQSVWWCGDDEWVTRLGGVAATALDPAGDGPIDHRHLRALAAGATVRRVAPTGWTEVTRDSVGATVAHEREWIRTALA